MISTVSTGPIVPFEILACLLVAAAMAYILCFIYPTIKLVIRLKAMLGELRNNAHAPVGLSALDSVFRRDKYLARSWESYKKTLPLTWPSAERGERAAGVRATLSATVCFDKHHIIDVPLKLEFFRHFPGLMTGVGIFGTFFGLLLGLRRFAGGISPTPLPIPALLPSTAAESAANTKDAFVSFRDAASSVTATPPLKVLDFATGASGGGAHTTTLAGVLHPANTLKSVLDSQAIITAMSHLLSTVSESFVVSAIAILSALLMTFTEKLMLAYCLHYLHDMTTTIDELFEFNHSDDYVVRIAVAAEATARQAARIALSMDTRPSLEGAVSGSR